MKQITFILILIALTGCKTRNIFTPRHQTVSDGFKLLTKDYIHVLQPDDKISVSIWGHDELSLGSAFSIYNTNESFGKWILIEKDSTASLPYIGVEKIGGLTTRQAEAQITQRLSKTIKAPIVEIKVLNREITVLGEVKSPGNYIIEKDLNTLVEAIGKAEGINYYGNPKRIQVIRDNISYYVDLSQMKNLKRKNIYLKSGDIIFVPSGKGKRFDLKSSVIIPYASLITSLGVIFTIINRQ